MAGLGGCATDLFHGITVVGDPIAEYEPRGRLDACAVLRVRPECVARWRDGVTDKEALAAPDEPCPAGP
jgi:hypothetical protein